MNQRRTRLILLLALLVLTPLAGGTAAVADEAGERLLLTLPPEFYAVAGQPMGFHFGNLLLSESPGDYRFEVACEIGESDRSGWSVTPTADDVGIHRLRVSVTDAAGNALASAKTTLHVVPADAGAGRTIKLLIVGDSLTHATLYPNEIARLLSQPGNPVWTMLGTNKPGNAAQGVAHEGYGGWTWQRFVSLYNPNPDDTRRKNSSPFVFPDDEGQPHLDVARYFDEKCGGARPDYVIFLLGINDCFSANPADPQDRIQPMFKQAEIVLAAFRRAAPRAELGICLTPPPNTRDAAFEANYKGRYPRWGWKQIQHKLVRAQIDHFEQREDERLFIVPTELNLDPTAGYPASNGVHPNPSGYRQIGGSIHAWLKHRLWQASKGLKRTAR